MNPITTVRNMLRESDRRISISRGLDLLDHVLFFLFIGFLIFSIATSTKMNIAADSVDYYAILQWVTPEKEKPIVRNLHFAEQRSPGYSLLSIVPYSILSILVEPFVNTDKVEEDEPPEFLPNSSGERIGSEMMFLPPQPLLAKDLFFRDFYIPAEGSWYQWKLALSLLSTSVFFLFVGIWSNAKVLRLYYPAGKCLFIIPATLLTAPTFMRNVIDLPLFATLTVYGLASLFFLFMCLSSRSNKAWQVILSGLTLGLLVLTRLELSILAILLAGFFLVTQKHRFLILFCLGGLVGFHVLVFYNLSFFGVPVHFGILRGDINTFGLDPQYVFESIVHPDSGILFWTPLLMPGLMFLVFTKDSILRVIGLCSFVLIIFYTLRIPMMYSHIGQGLIDIGGIPVTVPETSRQMRELIRFDINRYVSALIPFSVIGIRIGIQRIYNLLHFKNSAKQSRCDAAP